MKLTKENLLVALSEVQDPDLKKDLVSLGMIQNIHVSEDAVAFDVVLTTPACPLKELIKKDCEGAVASVRPQPKRTDHRCIKAARA